MLRQWKAWFYRHAAPDDTWRRRGLHALRQFLRFHWFRPAGAESPLQVYDAPALNAFLRESGTSPLTEAVPEYASREAARQVLRLLLARPDLRKRFPRALSEGAMGGFCRWLCAGGDESVAFSPQQIGNIEEWFQSRPGEHVRQVFDHHPDVRHLFPLALTPGGCAGFARWLLRKRKGEYRLCDEEVLWFLLECAEDPACGIAATWLRTPEWQRRHPDGLTPQGWRPLRDWLRVRYGIADDWLDRAELPTSVASSAADGLGLNVLGHFCHVSGQREALLTVVRALQRAGVATSCRDVPAFYATDLRERDQALGLEPYDCTLLQMAPEPFLHDCYARSGLAPRPGTYRIAQWYWELEVVPRRWARHARLIDEVWAPTRFIADAMRRALPMPVTDMPPGVELGPVAPLGRGHFGLPADRFLFLFVFDMRSILERKNPLAIVRAFRRAFRPDEPVALAFKVTHGDKDAAGLELLRREAGSVGALVLDRMMSRQEVNALLNCCDCYVSLHRSEGYGLTMAEAMLLGKPVIATGYSGNLDFMTPQNSLLVDYAHVPVGPEVPHYRAGGTWAEPSVEHAAHWMRWVVDHPDQARALGGRARVETERLLSLEAAGKRMRRRLEEIQARRGGMPRRARVA